MSAAQQPGQGEGKPPSGPAQRLEAVGRWLADIGGEAKPGEVGKALDLNGARQAEVLGAMRREGLVEGGRLVVTLTPAGWSRFARAADAEEGAGAVLERALTGWPQRTRAFIELAVTAVIARHHLGATHPDGHLGFMVIGPTRTGKSAAGRVVCRLFGWEPVDHELHMLTESAGSLLGRRQAVEGGATVWQPAAATRLPFVVLDEFDKADEQVQRRAWTYFQGKIRQQQEGVLHELLATPLLTANPPARARVDRYADLRVEYRRRSAVLDTADMAGRGTEIRRLVKDLEADQSARLSLDRLNPPARLQEPAVALLESLEGVLTEAGQDEWDPTGLELAALGRCALLGEGADHQLAALGTAVAFLQVTESRPGLVRPGWPAAVQAMREHLGEGAGVEALMAAVARGSAASQDAQRALNAGRQRAARVELDVQEAAATLAECCRLARAALDGRKVLAEHRAEAAGLRRVLATLGTRAANVSTAAALAEVSEQAAGPGGPLERSEALVRQAAAAVQQREQDARDQRSQAQQDKRAAEADRQHRAALARRQREDLTDQLRQTIETARPLEALYARSTTRPEESPWRQLVDLRVGGHPLLTYSAPPPQEAATTWRGRLGRVLDGRPSGTWRVAGSTVTFAGSAAGCPALEAWGANTRAVLGPTLRMLHTAEDTLRARGASGRARRRPEVQAVDRPEPLALPAPSARVLTAGQRPPTMLPGRRTLRNSGPFSE